MDLELDQFLSSAGGIATAEATPKPKSQKIPKLKPQSNQMLDDLPLFEREDFAELLEKDEQQELPVAPAKTQETPSTTRVVDADAVVMNRSTVTMYVIAVLSLIGLAFAAGFLVGSK